MKKNVIILIACVLLFSFKGDSPKLLKVELTIDQWNVVLETIDNSNSGHTQVKAIQQLIVPQLQKQIDSSNKK